MVRSTGARLLSRLARRRSLSSNGAAAAASSSSSSSSSSSPIQIRGGFRQFGSSIFSHDFCSSRNSINGIDANDTINMPRSGGADPEGKRPGDLDVIIKIRDDPIFRTKGSDIHVNAVVSITQAMLGGVVQVPTLTGDVAVKVCASAQPGQNVVLKGKGIRTRKSFGDQYVHFIVSYPENLTDRQREITEEFTKQEQREDDEPVAAAASS